MIRLGVCGWPVAHSRSPQMHNAALAQVLGLDDWRYQLLPLPPHLFTETVKALPAAGFRGVNVTIPHKEAALALADDATETARAIGAANTLTFEPDGAIHADNTDAPGFLHALNRSAYDQHRARARRRRLRPRRPLRAAARRAPESSASGTARDDRAQALADEFGADVGAEPADIVVNSHVGRAPRPVRTRSRRSPSGR